MNDFFVPEKAYKNLNFLNSRDARVIRILAEYLEPLQRMRNLKVNSTVLFLGSARADPDKNESVLGKYYWEAEELAFKLAEWAIKLKPKGKNFVICTGGGPGIMEAANKGAARAGGKSIGMNISLPHEQFPNSYISPELSFLFHYFFMRKFWLVYQAKAVIAFPGGYGTLDELFETLTLIQTEKMQKKHLPICLYGEKYWRNVINFKTLVEHGAIAPKELEIFHYCSDPEETFNLLKEKLIGLL
ncbi:MAG: TIGR00730 family Rossman fold protein [Candidatus Aminicenantes bacterium]|jgi:uncharacterized protein (TIGR00730 family)